jgi:hypothetical protein
MNEITVFKIRIDEISPIRIKFELFSGDKVKDTYVNVLSQGSYASVGRVCLSPRQFADFATRLIAYVHTTKSLDDEQLKVLWSLKINIFDHEAQLLSKSIFQKEALRLTNLGLIKEKNESSI